jgi:hypothetical protein
MMTIPGSRRRHYRELVSIFLLMVALMVGIVSCRGGGSESYDLTINSTAGGSVTTPGEGLFTYDEGTVVNLVAAADDDYEFQGWTGDTEGIADSGCRTTTIILNQDASIMANFGPTGPVGPITP